jgi:hypothetical protein
MDSWRTSVIRKYVRKSTIELCEIYKGLGRDDYMDADVIFEILESREEERENNLTF